MYTSPDNERIEKYLNELADEYKSLLFKNLVSQSKNFDDLSISDLFRLDNEVKKILNLDYQKYQKRRRMLFLCGFVYVFLGVTTFMILKVIEFDSIHNTNDLLTLMSIIIGFVGLLISMFSVLLPMPDYSKNLPYKVKTESTSLLQYEVITKWRELEGLVNDISIDKGIKTPRSIIEYLYINNFIDDNEYLSLKDFLKMRNNVVHSSADTYSSREIKELLSKIDKILDKIQIFV